MEPIVLKDATQELSSWHIERLEAGQILLFPQMPLELSEEDYRFLLRQRQTEASYHKNIAYRPAQDTLTGAASGSDREQLRSVLRAYAQQSARLLRRWLPHYAADLRLEFTSYRPFEEQGRKLSLHSRNDLLHVDAFPTRPTHGDRILRFFSNLNLEKPRVWLTSEPFEALAMRFAGEAGLLEAARQRPSPLRSGIARLARRVGLRRFTASPYDLLMHRFHNFLKENQQFQASCPKTRSEFPPKSSWLVFTDTASHAVLSGQFALEQTFIVPRHALLCPETAPVTVLERLAGVPLT